MLRDWILQTAWAAGIFPLASFFYFAPQLLMKKGYELVKARDYMISSCKGLAEKFGVFVICAIFLRWFMISVQQGAVGEGLLFLAEASTYIAVSFIAEAFLLLGIDWVMGKIRLRRHHREMKKRFANQGR